MSDASAQSGAARRLAIEFTLAGLLLLPIVVRATVPMVVTPYWDMDPLAFPAARSAGGLSPGAGMVCDLAAVLAGFLAVLWRHLGALGAHLPRLEDSPPPPPGRRGTWLLLLAPALALIAYHAWPGSSWATLGQQRVGFAWAGAIASAAGLWTLCSRRAVRHACLAVLIGVVGAMAVKGVAQVTVEFEESARTFRENREAILAANGWEPNSSMARGYERRLLQNEATAWFGLANPFATCAAVGLVVVGGLAVAGLRARLRGPLVLLGGGAVLCGIALVMAGAKGGFAAAAVGAAVVALVAWCGAIWPRVVAWLGPVLLAGVALAVGLRGVIGERIGELSVLFRWFYLEAGVRMVGERPLLGVGPDGVQRAYLLAKNPLSPEEVQSLHNAPMDWVVTLGASGLGLVFLVVWWLWRAGVEASGGRRQATVENRSTGSKLPVAQGDVRRLALRVALLVPALATVVGVMVLRPDVQASEAIVRLIALGVWCAMSAAVVVMLDRVGETALARAAMFGGAVVLGVHSMIEMTATLPTSAGLWWGLLAVLCRGGQEVETRRATEGRGGMAFEAVAVSAWCCSALVVISAGSVAAYRAIDWESHMYRAAEVCRPVAEARQLVMMASRNGDATSVAAVRREAMEAVASAERGLIGAEDASEQVPARLAKLETAAAVIATRELDAAADLVLDSVARRESSRLRMMLAAGAASRGDTAERDRLVREAIEVAQTNQRLLPDAVQFTWLATLQRTAASITGESALALAAMKTLDGAAAIDPYNPMHSERQLRIAQQLGLSDQIPAIANKLLRLDDLQRLDRSVRGLSEQDRAEVERLAGKR